MSPRAVIPAFVACILIPMISSADLFNDFRWKNRLLVVTAASEEDRTLMLLLQSWNQAREEVNDRDLRLIVLLPDGRVTLDGKSIPEPDASTLIERFGKNAAPFQMVLIGKDGEIKFRQDQPDLDSIFAIIDSMPMRQREALNDSAR